MTALSTTPARLLNTTEAATFLNMHQQWLEHARLDGRGPHVTRIGRYVRYRMEDLESFLDANRETKSNSM